MWGRPSRSWSSLVDHFLPRLTPRLGKPLVGVAEGSMQRLQAYPWPGNIRELQNILERATVLAQGSVVAIGDIGSATHNFPVLPPVEHLGLEENEKDHIRRAL